MCRSVLNWISGAEVRPLRKKKENLTEAVELFFETADEKEIQERTHMESYVTKFEVTVG